MDYSDSIIKITFILFISTLLIFVGYIAINKDNIQSYKCVEYKKVNIGFDMFGHYDVILYQDYMSKCYYKGAYDLYEIKTLLGCNIVAVDKKITDVDGYFKNVSHRQLHFLTVVHIKNTKYNYGEF